MNQHAKPDKPPKPNSRSFASASSPLNWSAMRYKKPAPRWPPRLLFLNRKVPKTHGLRAVLADAYKTARRLDRRGYAPNDDDKAMTDKQAGRRLVFLALLICPLDLEVWQAKEAGQVVRVA
ncbi:hypothetical protein GJ654_18595 [Rhodoblastus acidophilus]|uniref:Uncharacterized protein n=1 Tax=Rhodoblastus acidophilus TaxID=1074 RepID=A0A6N8DUZ4_RHOAC|nr:hypothetical protein [Rhodoblastus acidophilus]MCW2276334.1 hypothetical protein [Rhodoblastus acidophilus]MTV32993.1 hypothetical protein [Rhodoblastus acidophilus]